MTLEEFEALTATVAAAEANGGPRLEAYQDTEGIWTIGYGTNLQELTITHDLAEAMLISRLVEAQQECRRAFTWYAGLSVPRQQALCELVYNLGLPRLLGFEKFLAAMAAGDYVTARAELLDSKWRRQVKDRRAFRIADAIEHG